MNEYRRFRTATRTTAASFLMGLITGSAIGAGLVIYFSPRLALELCERMTDSTTGLRDAASTSVFRVSRLAPPTSLSVSPTSRTM
jgi:gas vesicle protein